ncbi:hypothetical protein TH63_17925 [Rufibacter radiotolerans]|uniref:DUF2255 family protein n=1 Tax=Rufibacter radiotolerans TaxID=1379910 RepID=A0A0H4VT48_9BACT|nr:DUF2255 family protein [Rufibacter radiotolerans]AKQ47092.1 hypothetical protein TH63_17925 [Rufibacter radiotolerans]
MNNLHFPQEGLDYLESHTLAGVKGGTDRDKFLDIWMVAVEGRVFARSWAKSNRSWFTAFQEQGVGELKLGDQVLKVTGKQLTDAHMNLLVDQAYKKKYTQEHNLIYVQGITQPEYHAYTMEFILRAN